MNGGGQQRGVPDVVDEDRALAALTLAWGDAYEVYLVEAADEDMLTGSTAAELNLAIRADWARKGMP